MHIFPTPMQSQHLLEKSVKFGGQQWQEQTHYLWLKLSTCEANSKDSKIEDVGIDTMIVLNRCLQWGVDWKVNTFWQPAGKWIESSLTQMCRDGSWAAWLWHSDVFSHTILNEIPKSREWRMSSCELEEDFKHFVPELQISQVTLSRREEDNSYFSCIL